MFTLRSALNFEISPILSGFALGTAWAIGMWWEGMPAEWIAGGAFLFTGLGTFCSVFNNDPLPFSNPRRRRREIIATVMYVIVTALLWWWFDIVHLMIAMVLLMSIAGHCILVKEILRLIRRRVKVARQHSLVGVFACAMRNSGPNDGRPHVGAHGGPCKYFRRVMSQFVSPHEQGVPPPG